VWAAVGEGGGGVRVGATRCSGLWGVAGAGWIDAESARNATARVLPLAEAAAPFFEGARRVAALKVDAEGSEVAVLRGALEPWTPAARRLLHGLGEAAALTGAGLVYPLPTPELCAQWLKIPEGPFLAEQTWAPEVAEYDQLLALAAAAAAESSKSRPTDSAVLKGLSATNCTRAYSVSYKSTISPRPYTTNASHLREYRLDNIHSVSTFRHIT
jgi:hypothetical protein